MAPPSHPFQGYRRCSTIMVYIYVLSLSSLAAKEITITIEPPKKVVTDAKILLQGIEQFESLETKHYRKYETNFTTNLWKGVYYNATAASAGWYGGAEGKGLYVYSHKHLPIKLEITKPTGSQEHGVNYFGLWASAAKAVDHLDFFYQKKPIFNTSLKLIYDKIPKESDYWKSPYNFGPLGARSFWVFINFYFGTEYDEVHLSSPTDWFCSDNHSIGRWENVLGDIIYKGELLSPEPSPPTDKPSPPSGKPSPPPDKPSPPPDKPSPPPDKPSLPEIEPDTKPRPEVPKAEPQAPKDEQISETEQIPLEAEPRLPNAKLNTSAKVGLIPTYLQLGLLLALFLV